MKISMVLLLLTISFAVSSSEEEGAEWNYTFDDTSYLNDWWVSHGNISLNNGALETTDCIEVERADNKISPAQTACVSSIWRENSATTGTWSFDYFRSGLRGISGLFFNFVGNDVATDGLTPKRGYSMSIEYAETIGLGEFEELVDAPREEISFSSDEAKPFFNPQWIHIEVTRQENGRMMLFLNDTLMAEMRSTSLSSSEYINIITARNDRIDNLSYSSTTKDPLSGNIPPYLLLAFGVVGLVIVGYGLSRYITKKNAKTTNPQYKDILRKNFEFNLSNESVITLFGLQRRVKTDDDANKIRKELPQDLLQYRYLMHPIRLSILKVLVARNKLTSVSIKQILGISWGEYRTHIKSLENKGYIELLNDFDEEGYIVQTVQILEQGRVEYLELFDLLNKFISSNSLFNVLLSVDDSNISGDELYPLDK